MCASPMDQKLCFPESLTQSHLETSRTAELWYSKKTLGSERKEIYFHFALQNKVNTIIFIHHANTRSSSRRSWMKILKLYQSTICLVMQSGIIITPYSFICPEENCNWHYRMITKLEWWWHQFSAELLYSCFGFVSSLMNSATLTFDTVLNWIEGVHTMS